MRRALLTLIAVATGIALIAIAAGFVWSGMTEDRVVLLGWAEDFPPGSVTTFTPMDDDGGPLLGWSRTSPMGDVAGAPLQVHVTNIRGEIVAFLGLSPHRGCRVDWRPDHQFEAMRGFFFDPCHNSTWLPDGTRVFGPTPRDLPRIRIEVTEGGRVLLHLDEVTEGEWHVGRVRSVPPRDRGPVDPTALATMPAEAIP